jgi:glycerate kinase
VSARPRAVVAPDKFKGSLTAPEAAQAIVRGISGTYATVAVPMADGGEGTVHAVVAGSGWLPVTVRVRGPLGAPVDATFAMRGDEALVEMATASGFSLLEPQSRDALRASSYGTGELVRAALDRGARRVSIAVGGTATNDGGAGALEALGVRLLDDAGDELRPGGAALLRLEKVEHSKLDERLRGVEFVLATDVDSPLLGPKGASRVFAAQKGASAAGVALLDQALARFADVLESHAHVVRARDDAGSGAGGGLPFAFRALFGAQIRGGFALVAEATQLRERLEGAALCLTGEGSIDAQTLAGKTVDGVCGLARSLGVPVVAFGGRVDERTRRELALRGCEAIAIAGPDVPAERAMRDAAKLLEEAARKVAGRPAR